MSQSHQFGLVLKSASSRHSPFGSGTNPTPTRRSPATVAQHASTDWMGNRFGVPLGRSNQRVRGGPFRSSPRIAWNVGNRRPKSSSVPSGPSSTLVRSACQQTGPMDSTFSGWVHQHRLADGNAVRDDQDFSAGQPRRHRSHRVGGQLRLGAMVVFGLRAAFLIDPSQHRQAEESVAAKRPREDQTG